MEVIPGHFATGNSHISHYLNMTELKSSALIAKDVSRELAIPYLASTLVDTIVCLGGTRITGSYLAEELLQDGTMVMNAGTDIHILTPLNNVNGQLIFQPNMQKMISGRNVLILVASVSTGISISRALECLDYYGGTLAGISALFSAIPSIGGNDIHAVFTSDNIEGYRFYPTTECNMCSEGQRIDAIINSDGYTKLDQGFLGK